MVLWINLGVWACFVTGIYQGSEFGQDIQGSEYMWVTVPEKEPKITV